MCCLQNSLSRARRLTPWWPSCPERALPRRQQPRFNHREDAVELMPRMLQHSGAHHGGDEKRRPAVRIEIAAKHSLGDACCHPFLDSLPPVAKHRFYDLADGGIAPPAQLEFAQDRRQVRMPGAIETRIGEFLL